MRNRVFEQIINQVFDGENIMCCFPRRSGKTDLIVQFLNRPLVDGNVVIIAPHMIHGDDIEKRCGRKIEHMTYSSLIGLRGRFNIDCVIFEDPGSWTKPEQFVEAVNTVKKLRCQMIFVFTPFVYDPKDPHPLKILWDTAAYYKYQLTSGVLDGYEKVLVDREHWAYSDFQTEVEGNWVAQ